MKKTILIGVGNRFRSDDGVGGYITDQLRTKVKHDNIKIDESCGEGAGLMSSWDGYERVYLFDAVMSQNDTGKIHRLQANQQNIPSDFFKYSSHAFSLAESVELARTLDCMPDELVIFGIEAKNFNYGDTLSSEVKISADEVITRVVAELSSI